MQLHGVKKKYGNERFNKNISVYVERLRCCVRAVAMATLYMQSSNLIRKLAGQRSVSQSRTARGVSEA